MPDHIVLSFGADWNIIVALIEYIENQEDHGSCDVGPEFDQRRIMSTFNDFVPPKLIPLESLGSYRTVDPRKGERPKLPPFEGLIPEAMAEEYREWKKKKRLAKPRKRKAAHMSSDSPPDDPRDDPDFDPSDPLGLEGLRQPSTSKG